MHTREISRDAYETTLGQLRPVTTYMDGGMMVSQGWHKDCGRTKLTRDGDRFVAMVEDPSFLDKVTCIKWPKLQGPIPSADAPLRKSTIGRKSTLVKQQRPR
jgi:hypothetical protein